MIMARICCIFFEWDAEEWLVPLLGKVAAEIWSIRWWPDRCEAPCDRRRDWHASTVTGLLPPQLPVPPKRSCLNELIFTRLSMQLWSELTPWRMLCQCSLTNEGNFVKLRTVLCFRNVLTRTPDTRLFRCMIETPEGLVVGDPLTKACHLSQILL